MKLYLSPEITRLFFMAFVFFCTNCNCASCNAVAQPFNIYDLLQVDHQELDRDEDWELEIHVAARQGDVERVVQLLDVQSVDALDLDGNSPLHMAVRAGRMTVAQLLLGRGADVHRANRLRQTALHIASRAGSKRILSCLINRGAWLDVARADISGNLPLHYAASEGRIGVIKELLPQMTPQAISCANQDGQTALHLACQKGMVRAVRLLLQGGANPLNHDLEGKSLMDYACAGSHIKVIRLLVEHAKEKDLPVAWRNWDERDIQSLKAQKGRFVIRGLIGKKAS